MKLKILLFIFFALNFSFAQNQKQLSKKIDSIIENKNPRPFNGVILITEKGKTKYSKALGFTNFKTKIPLKISDQFEIMSNKLRRFCF